MLNVGDWTRSGKRGEWAHVTYSLTQSANPVTTIGVLLNGVLTEPLVDGSDLRREYGRYFRLPMQPGAYTLIVTAADACGHEAGSSRPMTVNVK